MTTMRWAALALCLVVAGAARAQEPAGGAPEWPAVTAETRPWTRWWWMGSAVDSADLTRSLEAYRAAGLGGVEVTPIYGVHGYEAQFIPYLSPAWVGMLSHTLDEARRLGMGVDMATGTGWPFGGPWVGAADASRNVVYTTYSLDGGERLRDTVAYRQEPLVRSVGRPGLEIGQLVEPVSDNPDLQSLALDQVRFPRRLPLQALVAYPDSGAPVELTDRVDDRGRLDWTAPPGHWTLYAVFQGWHGKMVERAAPGGEGYALDHFSGSAVRDYLRHFDQALAGTDLTGLHGFFNDSYEVDDARGEADWTPALFAEFRARRGYDLRDHLPALFGKADAEENARVRSDYRETVSDLLLDRFTRPWREWARTKGAVVRDQAHGSPGNLLDLYAAADVPETEGAEVLRFKWASSAAHVTGRPLTSSESATWLNEHFLATLGQVRGAVDRFFLGGVNHVLYHGVAYSPQDAPWPGWLFYAAVHFTPANPIWADFDALNGYVARVQSFLQQGVPENDVLLYFPVHDTWATPGNALLVHFDGTMRPFQGTSFAAAAETMQRRGWAFDFVSDRQLREVRADGGALRTGGTAYRVVLLPETHYLPAPTLEKLVSLARAGATVAVHRALPADVPGLGDLPARRETFRRLLDQLDFGAPDGAGLREARVGAGRVLLGDDVEALLERAGARREAMTDQGLAFVRRRMPDGYVYFVANRGEQAVDGWVPLEVGAAAAALYDPLLGHSGYAATRPAPAGRAEVYLQLRPGETRIVRTWDAARSGAPVPYVRAAGEPTPLAGQWSIRFVEGGPELPPAVQTGTLGSWTDLPGEEVKRFGGTAVYSLHFPRPRAGSAGVLLDLGRVCESAEVRLNGQPLGTLIGPDFHLRVDPSLLRDRNTLEVSVTNLAANRIADMDRRGVEWKIFYNVNFPPHERENRGPDGLFDASKWSPRCSGLVGPVTLTPVDRLQP
jgi:hypothetical protein